MENFEQIAREEETRWQQTFDAITQAVKKTKQNADDDFKEAKRLTAELVNTRREEDQQQIASDEAVAHGLSRLRENQVSKLELLLEQPYFARLECQEGDRKIAFHLGLASFPEKRIIDWREAPISRLYYEYSEGDDYDDEIAGQHREGHILIRRGFKGKGRELHLIECPEGQIVKQKGKWEFRPFRSDDQGGRIRSRMEGEEAHLPPILSLITAEQYEIITSLQDKPLMIEGIAGSGKTTVALHRLSWLLHQNNSPAKANNSFILVFNYTLKLYIMACLPELGMKDVKVFTFQEWVRRRLGLSQPEKSQKWYPLSDHLTQFKSLDLFENCIPSYLLHLKNEVLSYLEGTLNTLDPKSLDNLKQNFLEDQGPMVPSYSELKSKILQLLSGKEESFLSTLRQIFKKIDARLLDGFLEVKKFWEFLEKLESLPSSLPQDLPFKKCIHESLQRLEDSFYDNQDYALILALGERKFGKNFRGQNINLGFVDHLVIDEIQDLSPLSLKSLYPFVERPEDLTLVGDFGQQIYEEGKFHCFSDIIASLGLQQNDLVELRLSFRSTRQILELAQHIRHEGEVMDQDVQGVFVGPEPEFVQVEGEQEFLFSIRDWVGEIKQRYPGAHCAILCKTSGEASKLFYHLQNLNVSGIRLGDHHHFSFAPGITVTNIFQVKGLEFRHVLICNPSEEKFALNNRKDRNLLYVGITRAEERLDFLLKDAPTPLLPLDLWEARKKAKEIGDDLEWFSSWQNEDY